MNPHEQNQTIKDVLTPLRKRSTGLDKRILNLESAEYAILNHYGSMYQYNLGTVIAITVAGTFYPITSMVTGLLNGWTFADPALTCVKAGVYHIVYSISVTGMQSNHTHLAISHSGTLVNQSRADFFSTSPGGHQSVAGNAVVRTVAGDTIRLMIANLTDTDDPTIDVASVAVHKIGE